jgi:hypothetical protein
MSAQRGRGRTRGALKVREPLIPVALFVLAFASALLALRQPKIGALDRAHAATPANGTEPANSAALANDVARALGADSRADASGAPGVAASGERRRAEEPASAPAKSDAAAAVEMQGPAQTLDAALDTLDYSLSPDDRARAIRSLAATAPDGSGIARVRSSLRIAAADEDPDVAARAQETYDALVERYDR